MQAETSPRLITIAEAAEAAQRHPATIRRWIKSGELTAWKVNRTSVRVELDEVKALVEPIPVRSSESLQERAQRIAAGWPPLSADQIERLVALLCSGGGHAA